MDGESELLLTTSESNLSIENELSFCDSNNEQSPSNEKRVKRCEQNHSEKAFVCGNCYEVFRTKSDCVEHSKNRNCEMVKKKSPVIKYTGKKSFKYDVCRKSFSYESNFQKNIQKHTGNTKYFCHGCQKSFPKKINMRQHLCIHTGEKPYTCEVCFKHFASRSQVNVHSRIHTDEKPYTCEICCKKFRHIDTLKYHNSFVHSEPGHSQLHICEVCDRSFKKRTFLLKHELKHKKAFEPNLAEIKNPVVDINQDDLKHGSNEKQFKNQDNVEAHDDTHSECKPNVCHILQQCFSDQESFQMHSDTHTSSTTPIITSSYSCSKNFCENLQQDCHSHVQEKFICDVCDEQFDNSDNLTIHLKKHAEEKYYICKVCQLCFLDEGDLLNHENLEKCANFHTCKICGEKFMDKTQLETHCETHVAFENEISSSSSLNKPSNLDQPSKANIERNVSERSSNFDDSDKEKVDNHVKNNPYNCEQCNKNFANESDFKHHNLLHSDKKPHVCVLCLKNFDDKRELETHICKYDNNEKKSALSQAQKDNEAKGYVCSVCLKSFTYYYGFQIHMFEHTQENECKTCKKRFFTASSLEAHRLQNHKPPMHPCIVCKEKFSNKNDLLVHCISHLGSGEYFICGSCKQCFKGREDLQKHNPCSAKT